MAPVSIPCPKGMVCLESFRRRDQNACGAGGAAPAAIRLEVPNIHSFSARHKSIVCWEYQAGARWLARGNGIRIFLPEAIGLAQEPETAPDDCGEGGWGELCRCLRRLANGVIHSYHIGQKDLKSCCRCGCDGTRSARLGCLKRKPRFNEGIATNCRMIHLDEFQGIPTMESTEQDVRAHARPKGFVFLGGRNCISVGESNG